jgi:hypothetical protein
MVDSKKLPSTAVMRATLWLLGWEPSSPFVNDNGDDYWWASRVAPHDHYPLDRAYVVALNRVAQIAAEYRKLTTTGDEP